MEWVRLMETKTFAMILGKFAVKDIAIILHARGLAGSIQSGDAIARRVLKDAVAMGILKEEKHKGRSVYMLPHLTNYTDHDDLITQALVLILSRWDAHIEREKLIEAVALRPDCIALVQDGNRYACLIIEAISTENERYFQQKRTTWERWAEAKDYLSALFGIEVKSYHLCTYGKGMGVMTLESAIQQMEGAE